MEGKLKVEYLPDYPGAPSCVKLPMGHQDGKDHEGDWAYWNSTHGKFRGSVRDDSAYHWRNVSLNVPCALFDV